MAWHGRDPSKIGGRLSANAFHSDKKVFFRPAVDAIKTFFGGILENLDFPLS